PADGVSIDRNGQTAALTGATLGLDVTVATDGQHGTVNGSFSVTTAFGSSQGAVLATAVRSNGAWEVAGSARTNPFSDESALGGFRATIVDPGDGSITASWSF